MFEIYATHFAHNHLTTADNHTICASTLDENAAVHRGSLDSSGGWMVARERGEQHDTRELRLLLTQPVGPHKRFCHVVT